MRGRLIAAGLAAVPWLGIVEPAVCARAQAAAPFPEVEVVREVHRSHLLADLTMVAGAGLIGASFLLRDRANHLYSDYLSTTDPRRIESLYDRTVRTDRLSSGALISGEVLVATGLYLRFLRRPTADRVAFSVLPERCAVSFRF